MQQNYSKIHLEVSTEKDRGYSENKNKQLLILSDVKTHQKKVLIKQSYSGAM